MNKQNKTVEIEVIVDGNWVVVRWDKDETWLSAEQATAFGNGLLAAVKETGSKGTVQ